MPGRKYNSVNGYRYGFNGQENSDEIAVGLTTAMYWEYDSRIGRRWNVNPLTNEYESPFVCLSNNPILKSDLLGNTPTDPTGWVKTGEGKMVYDSRVTDHESAGKYYPGGIYSEFNKSGSSYTTKDGEKIVLGKDGNFTIDGVEKHSPDLGFLSLEIKTLETTSTSGEGEAIGAKVDFGLNYKYFGFNGGATALYANAHNKSEFGNILYTPTVLDIGLEATLLKENIDFRFGTKKNSLNIAGTVELYSANANVNAFFMEGADKKYGAHIDANAGAYAAKAEANFGGTLFVVKTSFTVGGTLASAHAGITIGGYYPPSWVLTLTIN
jgi:hypothetical protein